MKKGIIKSILGFGAATVLAYSLTPLAKQSEQIIEQPQNTPIEVVQTTLSQHYDHVLVDERNEYMHDVKVYDGTTGIDLKTPFQLLEKYSDAKVYGFQKVVKSDYQSITKAVTDIISEKQNILVRLHKRRTEFNKIITGDESQNARWNYLKRVIEVNQNTLKTSLPNLLREYTNIILLRAELHVKQNQDNPQLLMNYLQFKSEIEKLLNENKIK